MVVVVSLTRFDAQRELSKVTYSYLHADYS